MHGYRDLTGLTRTASCADPVHSGQRGPGSWLTLFGTRPRYLGDSGPGRWRDTFGVHVAGGGHLLRCGSSSPTDPEEAAVVLVELGPGGAALSGRARGAQRRGVGDRCGPPPRGGPPDGARVVAPVRGRGVGRVGRSVSSKPLSCPHQMAPEVEARIVEMRRAHPGWGPRTILFWLDRGRGVAVAGPVLGRAVPGASRAGHPAGAEAEAVGLQAVGTVAGRWSCGRWTSSVGCASSTGRRRRSCRASMTTRGSWSRRGWWRGRRRGRCATR